MTNAQICTLCTTGFVLSGWNCLSTFNFGFSVQLNTNTTTFFNNYQAFLLALLAPVNTKQLDSITITNINTGTSRRLL
jgi:hypothetical protein